MAIISKEEVLKIAKISHITLHEDEVDQVTRELEAVLSYAARVQEIASQTEEPLTKNVNIFREDVVVPSDPEVILQQAPQREENFFVVPVIIEK